MPTPVELMDGDDDGVETDRYDDCRYPVFRKSCGGKDSVRTTARMPVDEKFHIPARMLRSIASSHPHVVLRRNERRQH